MRCNTRNIRSIGIVIMLLGLGLILVVFVSDLMFKYTTVSIEEGRRSQTTISQYPCVKTTTWEGLPRFTGSVANLLKPCGALALKQKSSDTSAFTSNG